MEKTRFVDFNKEDFNFMGFTFEHWRPRKKDSTLYYMVRPSEESLKDFRAKIKEKTKKTLTLNSKAWIERVNPVIRGKVGYYIQSHTGKPEIPAGEQVPSKLLWQRA